MEKRCSNILCEVNKLQPIESFHKGKSACKTCRKSPNGPDIQYYKNNLKQISEKRKIYDKSNRENIRSYKREYNKKKRIEDLDFKLKANHYTNLQPMCHIDNLKKGSK
jgi:hypothetical protein